MTLLDVMPAPLRAEADAFRQKQRTPVHYVLEIKGRRVIREGNAAEGLSHKNGGKVLRRFGTLEKALAFLRSAT